MNTLQQIEEDIKEFLDKELKEGEIFFNECEFQVKLALFLIQKKGYKVHLEYSVPLGEKKMQFPNKGKIDIDIVIEKDELFYPIELKYKIKQEEVKFNRFGEDTSYLLKEHLRIPMSKYDFWKDVARLEFLKESFNNVVGGLCVFLTNNKIYKEEGSSKDFSMKKKNPVNNKRPLRFETPGLAKKCPEFLLLEEYQIDEWHNIKNEKTNIDFHYCMVRVEKRYNSNTITQIV